MTEEKIEKTEKKTEEKKPKSLLDLQKSFKKEFGKNTVKLGDEIEEVPVLCSSGSISLDSIIGIGGIPRGRIIEFFGQASGGKTLFSLLTAIQCQKQGGIVAFQDLENSFDRNWFLKLGGNMDENKFMLIKPESGTDAYEMIDQLVSSEIVDLVIVDSVSTMISDAEKENSYASEHMAKLARMMSNGLKKLNSTMLQHPKSSVIFINQTRSGMDKYHPEVTTGGNALPFYASLRMKVQRVSGKDGILGDESNPEGFLTRCKIVKSKVGPPLRTVEVSVYVNHPTKIGVVLEEELLSVAISMGIIKRYSKNKETDELIEDVDGSYYEFNDKQFYGKPKFMKYIESDPSILEGLKPIIFSYLSKKEKPEPDSFLAEVKEEEKKQRKSRKNKDEEN